MSSKNSGFLEIIHLEDDVTDAALIKDLIEGAGIRSHIQLVKSRDEYVAALEAKKYDLILCDNTIPSFSGTGALLMARGMAPDTPFIFVTGTMGEESAVQTLRDGATDYVLKPGLARLVPTVRRAISEADDRRKLKLAEKMREMALEDLKTLEAKYRGVLESAPDAVIIVDKHGSITFANKQAESDFGYSGGELIGKTINLLVPKRFQKMHEKQLHGYEAQPHSRPMSTGTELFGKRKDGTEFPADIMLSPFVSGRDMSVLAMVRDLTEPRKAEKAVKESEERFRTIFEVSPLAMVNIDGEGRFLRCNQAAVKLFGYSQDELLAMTFNDITHPEDRSTASSIFSDILSGKKDSARFEKRYVCKDGRVVLAHLTIAAVRGSQGKFSHAVTIVEDITERRAAEDALKRSEEEYRGLVEGVRDAIFKLSLDGSIQSLNPAFEAITGWRRGEWIGRNISELIHPSDVDETLAAFGKMISVTTPVILEIRIACKSSGYVIMEFNSAPQIRDGETVGVLCIARDVTGQKMLEEQLRQSQKLEGLGTLAGGIAHDFNNILAIINGYTSFLRRTFQNDEQGTKSLDAITSAVGRATGLVRQLLTFARKQERVPGYVDLNEIVMEMYTLVSETFPKQVKIEIALHKGRAIVYGDRSEIHQLLLNLCVNARDAMMERPAGNIAGGVLKISTALVKESALLARHPTAGGHDYIELSVSDTGVGMDEETKSRIFEPFFTTKPEGKGTGLGLATVYGIVQSHGGFIDVSSVPGNGTTFSVHFAAERGTDESADNLTGSEGSAVGGSETILVVEDEPGLRDYVQDLLMSEGYKVLTAQDGERAISIFINQSNINLILSDIGLPKIGGIDLLETVKVINPDTRIILASGFVEENERRRMEEKGVKAFIQKPYQREELLKKIRSVLDE